MRKMKLILMWTVIAVLALTSGAMAVTTTIYDSEQTR